MLLVPVLMMLLVVTSCAPGAHKTQRMSIPAKYGDHSSEYIDDALVIQRARTQQAKHLDIPVPLHAVPFSLFYQQEQSDSIEFAYFSNEQPDTLVSWYMVQMESLGWQYVSQSIGIQTVLLYQKPTRWCMLSLRRFHDQDKTECIITVLPKSIDLV